MTNSENTSSPEPTDHSYVSETGAKVTFIPFNVDPVDVTDTVEFVDTPATFQLSLADVVTPYRYLAWVEAKAARAFHADLTGFSPERVAGIAALVDNGLVSERRWTGGLQDGRVTYRLTPTGDLALHAAWAEADQVVRSS